MSAPFHEELAALLNRHSKENGSNTPDHLLAGYLVACLEAFDRTTGLREHWYGCHHLPGHEPSSRPLYGRAKAEGGGA